MKRMTKARTEYLLHCHDAAKEPSAYEAFARGWEKALEAASVWMLAAAQDINRVQMERGHVLKDEFGMKHPVMPVDEQVEIMKKHFQAWSLGGGFCADKACPDYGLSHVHPREPRECPLCGPGCLGGAHRTALAEDGVDAKEQVEAASKIESKAKHKSEAVPARPTIFRSISGAQYFLEAEEAAVEYVLALEAVLGEYRKSGGHHQGCVDLTKWSFDGRDHRCSACVKADALLSQ